MLPYSVILWAALAAVVIFVLRRTAPGRRVYAVGLNRTASRYAGVRVGWTVVGLYTASGVCAAIVGILVTGYTGSSYFGSGDAYQLGSVAAVVVGGTSIYGGRGGYGGTIAGALIIVFSESILRIVNIADAGRRIAYGVLILVLLVSTAAAAACAAVAVVARRDRARGVTGPDDGCDDHYPGCRDHHV